MDRYILSNEGEDLDKLISHSTEAILLPFHTPIKLGSHVIGTLFNLAFALHHRSHQLKQPGDVKHAITYLRYLQGQSLETSSIPRNGIKTFLMLALFVQVNLESLHPMRDIGEMATLCRELLTSGVELIHTANALTGAICMTSVPYRQPPPDEVIECLREARIRFPHLEEVCFALVESLDDRFIWAHSHDDYEEAKSVLDEIIADPNGNVKRAMSLAGMIALGRYTRDPKPEHLADAIFRNRTHLNAMSSKDPEHLSVVKRLADLEKDRFEEFGVKSGRQEDIAEVVDESHLVASPQMAQSNLVEFPLPMPDRRNLELHINALNSILDITDPTNIEKATEHCRLCLTSPHSHPVTHAVLSRLLYRDFRLTGNTDFLHESIAVHRDLIKMEGVPINHHSITVSLLNCLLSRSNLFKGRRDSDEIMELFAAAATDTRTDIPSRFRISCLWTQAARSHRHPTTLTAYQTAISLMQESLSFAPTLEIQHFRLVAMRDQCEKLPLDYASYLVQVGQLKQAIETLERGRGLLWSEMRASALRLTSFVQSTFPWLRNLLLSIVTSRQ